MASVRAAGERWSPLRSPVGLVVAVPVVFVLMLVIFWATERVLGWPETEQERDIATFVAIGVAVLLLLPYVVGQAFGFLAERQAKVGLTSPWGGIEIDLSRAVPAAVAAAVSPQAPLPDNIVAAVEVQDTPDSDTPAVALAVQRATATPIVTIDLGDGRAWWATRLLALSAGAVRFGTPEALAFVATKANVERTFVGWAEPRPVLEALLRSYPSYAEQYYVSLSLHQQLLLGHTCDSCDHVPPPGFPSPTASSYLNAYVASPDYSFMDILMRRLSRFEPHRGAAALPDEQLWLTLGRLNDLLAHCLYTDVVELNGSVGSQVDAILTAPTRYVAATRECRFVGLARVDQTVRTLVKLLVQPLTKPPEPPQPTAT